MHDSLTVFDKASEKSTWQCRTI